MNTIKIALATALVFSAASSAFAGLYDADPRFVNTQSLTDSYPANDAQVAGPQGRFDQTYGLSDAERVTVLKNADKDYNK